MELQVMSSAYVGFQQVERMSSSAAVAVLVVEMKARRRSSNHQRHPKGRQMIVEELGALAPAVFPSRYPVLLELSRWGKFGEGQMHRVRGWTA